jgi:gamma-glutamyl:cysteine ligase YbdK (ATP-grasp superfamily)
MIDESSADRITTVMKNCSSQLRRAHSDLSRMNTPIDPLAKISGVADALDALSGQIVEIVQEARQASRIAGGLTAQVRSLRRSNEALSSRAIERL